MTGRHHPSPLACHMNVPLAKIQYWWCQHFLAVNRKRRRVQEAKKKNEDQQGVQETRFGWSSVNWDPWRSGDVFGMALSLMCSIWATRMGG